MRVAIHQPHYLPWLRYFDKLAKCDVFILLDTVDYTKNGWQNRNKIKAPEGGRLLTVPVSAHIATAIKDIAICDNGWRKKHWRSIEQCYAKAPHFSDHAGILWETYNRAWRLLADLNDHMFRQFAQALGLGRRIVRASELDVPGEATERLVNLIRAVGGDTYYTGAYALEQYLDAHTMADAGIALDIQHWNAPVYPQLHGDFVADLSILDLLMNCGPRSSAVLLGEQP